MTQPGLPGRSRRGPCDVSKPNRRMSLPTRQAGADADISVVLQQQVVDVDRAHTKQLFSRQTPHAIPDSHGAPRRGPGDNKPMPPEKETRLIGKRK